jgi:restriction system protein
MVWEKRIAHEGLHTYRVIRGVTREETELKAWLQSEAWDARWKRIQELKIERLQRLERKTASNRRKDDDERAKSHALELTREAEANIAALRRLLSDSVAKDNHLLGWESLRDSTQFTKPNPRPPSSKPLPVEPSRTEDRFKVESVRPHATFLDWIILGSRKKKIAAAQLEERKRRGEADKRFDEACLEWRRCSDEITKLNENALADHEKAKAAVLLERHVFEEQQRRYNDGIKEFRQQYLSGLPEAIVRYCTEVLSQSEYPDSFPRDCAVSFDAAVRLLALDFELPPQNAVPNKKQVKYISNREEFQDIVISDSEFKRLYDDVLYQICLKTLYELFRADELDAVKAIVFNGWVHAIDKATGADTHPCVMTVQVAKSEFLGLNLEQVDLKACFRSLKGISGSKLSDFSPVRPVLSLNREDPRFVGSYNVAEALSDKTNLAAMDWLDFENLIRELFEKEFSKNGGEVKITQASRDGGVDAIAFDPDPIRGGKIVIQAKRYTNTVGVSAVRDLYGTVHNEGATKGILVTTSDYGPDAYEFAKGKPLTLLSGGELLYLLSRHGYHAKIDIKEAKKLLGEI